MFSTDKTLLLPQTDVEYGETVYSSVGVCGGGDSSAVCVEHHHTTSNDSSSSSQTKAAAADTIEGREEIYMVDLFHLLFLVLLIGYVLLYSPADSKSALLALGASLIPISLWHLSKTLCGRRMTEDSAKKDSSTITKPAVESVVVVNDKMIQADREDNVCGICLDILTCYCFVAGGFGLVMLFNTVLAAYFFLVLEGIFFMFASGGLSGIPSGIGLSNWTAKHKADMKRIQKVELDVFCCDALLLVIRCGGGKHEGMTDRTLAVCYDLAICVAIFTTSWFLWRICFFLHHLCRHSMKRSSNNCCSAHSAFPGPLLVGDHHSELTGTDDLLSSNAQ